MPKEFALFDAINNENFAAVKKVVEADPGSVSRKSADGLPLDVLMDEIWDGAKGIEQEKIFSYLLEHKAPFSRELIHRVCGNTNFSRSNLADIISAGADKNWPSVHGKTTPIACAVSYHEDNFNYLIDLPDIKLDMRDRDGDNLLHRACIGPNPKPFITKLLSRGFDVNELNRQKKTPLNLLVTKEDDTLLLDAAETVEGAKVLLKAGGLFDINNPSKNIPIVKNIYLGFEPNSSEGPQIFDKMVGELKRRNSKLSRRIPKEGISDEFNAFAEVLGNAYTFSKALDPNTSDKIPSFLADMMERTDGTWQKVRDSLQSFSQADCKDVADMMRGFTESILLPEIAQRTRSRASRVDYKASVDFLIPEVAATIVGSKTLLTMLKLSRSWHNNVGALENARTVPRTGSWEKAAPDFTASNGYVIQFLDTATKLAAEGKDLHHCVGGYTEKCKRENLHIASIRKVIIKDGDTRLIPVSTVEFREKPGDNVPMKIEQHRGPHDAVPASGMPEAAALKEFMMKIDKNYKGEDKIIIDFSKIHARKAQILKEPGINDVKGMIGYDPLLSNAPDKQDEFLKRYMNINSQSANTHSFIPGGHTQWNGKSTEDFLIETKLMDKIDEIIKNPPLLPIRGQQI